MRNYFIYLFILICFDFTLGQSNQLNDVKYLNFSTPYWELFRYPSVGVERNNIAYTGVDTIKDFNFKFGLKDSMESLTTIYIYIKEGVKYKVEQYFNNNSQLHRIASFNEKGVNGWDLSYYENGSIMTREKFMDGKRIGPRLMFYKSGQLLSYAQGPLGREVQQDYFENGTMSQEVLPLYPQKDSIFEEDAYSHKWWYENGQLKMSSIINKGKQLCTYYHENGVIGRKGTIFNSPWNMLGKWEEWHNNGKKKKEEYYSEDTGEWNKKEGTWLYWDYYGNLIKKEMYREGKIFQTKDVTNPNLKKDL